MPADRQTYAAFNRRWDEPAVRLAGWADFMAVCGDENIRYDTLALRRDLFWHLVQAADYSPERMSDLLAEVLADSRRYIDRARWQLGEIAHDQLIPRSPHEAAGLTGQERGRQRHAD